MRLCLGFACHGPIPPAQCALPGLRHATEVHLARNRRGFVAASGRVALGSGISAEVHRYTGRAGVEGDSESPPDEAERVAEGCTKSVGRVGQIAPDPRGQWGESLHPLASTGSNRSNAGAIFPDRCFLEQWHGTCYSIVA